MYRIRRNLSNAHFRTRQVSHDGDGCTNCFGCQSEVFNGLFVSFAVTVGKIQPCYIHPSFYHFFHNLYGIRSRPYGTDNFCLIFRKRHVYPTSLQLKVLSLSVFKDNNYEFLKLILIVNMASLLHCMIDFSQSA